MLGLTYTFLKMPETIGDVVLSVVRPTCVYQPISRPSGYVASLPRALLEFLHDVDVCLQIVAIGYASTTSLLDQDILSVSLVAFSFQLLCTFNILEQLLKQTQLKACTQQAQQSRVRTSAFQKVSTTT